MTIVERFLRENRISGVEAGPSTANPEDGKRYEETRGRDHAIDSRERTDDDDKTT